MKELIDEEYLPHCLAIGISRAEFGELNIKKLRPYILAEDIRFEKTNRDAHLYGRYVFDAVSIAISNALRGKGDKPTNYMDKPYDLTGKRQERDEEEINRINIEKAKAQFMAFAQRTKTRLEDK